MRLQLTVQRHGLPPVQVLWNVGLLVRPPYAAAGTSITISQLLEQVNDIIPLESEDWGLEDYAVEVRGFECLHFSELSEVLKEDDEVCIRALQTSDLRIRKFSGRHQISSDGKHLIDGVAFGRPFLRRADRPAVRIPPRKRRRITYDEENEVDVEGQINDRQIEWRPGFDDSTEATAGDGSDNDEDFVLDEEGVGELGQELEGLQNDLHGSTAEDTTVSDWNTGRPRRSNRLKSSPKGLGLLPLLDDNGQKFPGLYSNPLLDIYSRDDPPETTQSLKIGKRRKKKSVGGRNKAKDATQDASANPEQLRRRDSTSSNKSVRFEDEAPATPATIQEAQDFDDTDDEDFEPAGFDESDKENAEPRKVPRESSIRSLNSSESGESSSSEYSTTEWSEGDETSSSGSSPTTSSSSDSEPEQLPSKDPRPQSDTSNTSSSGPSSSDSDTEVEAHKVIQEKTKNNLTPKNHRQKSAETIAPGRGKKGTQRRNQRRKAGKKLTYLKNKGLLPATATTTDLQKFNEEGIPPNGARGDEMDMERDSVGYSHSKSQRPLTNEKLASTNPLEAKKQDLMSVIASAGTDVTPESTRQESNLKDDATSGDTPGKTNVMDKEVPQAAVDNLRLSTGATEDMVDDYAAGNDTTTASAPTQVPDPGATSSLGAKNRRSRLDVAGTRRMLFGSLGLKTPKTKEEDQKMREKLMKDIKPIRRPQPEEESEAVKAVDITADDSWKDEIDLRAVECCYDGIELSTPPFPFVQRWDPQQQRGYNFGNNKKRKGKKRKRNNTDYYEQTPFQESQYEGGYQDGYSMPNHPEKPISESSMIPYEESGLHDQSFEDSVAVNDQLLRETGIHSTKIVVQAEESLDLPDPPEDLSNCPSLTKDDSTPGSIVAFKKLDMSAETNWQPSVSEYRTAIIDRVTENGLLQMTSAKRDRPVKTPRYDKKTGDRLYSKFEMPGYSDEDEDNDGTFEMSFNELISPVLLRAGDTKTDAVRPLVAQSDTDKRHEQNGMSDLDYNNKKEAGFRQNLGNDGAMEHVTIRAAITPSEETRREVSEIFKDAGWQSSVNAGVNGELQEKEGSRAREDDFAANPPSPRFSGFSFSSLHDRIDVESSPSPVGVQASPQQHASDFEIAESIPPQGDYNTELTATSSVRYPSLSPGDDDNHRQQLPQRLSGIPEIDTQTSSQALSSPNQSHQPMSQSARSPARALRESSSPKLVKAVDGEETEDEFPELFSQAFDTRMSQDIEVKSESLEDEEISPPSYRRSKPNGRLKPSNSSPSEVKDEHNSVSMAKFSQQAQSSQIIDLTTSDDIMDPPDSTYDDNEDDSYRLPKGPGWSEKAKPSRGRTVVKRVQSRTKKARGR